MKAHTKLYMDFFGYDISDWISCEIPDCGNQGIDIHHIEARSMGGTTEPDRIENLMCLCRGHHEAMGDRKHYLNYLKEIHMKKVNEYRNK